ncbi:MAG TPA: aminoglycoside 6-adenylyltransferase [Anaerolineales bacterium]|nr:aminoglycoside 6-adenylyltransferase [Anaerolineales bacterium]
MRTEQQMLDLILHTAQTDPRVRAVIMNGSRANPNARRDIFQDFDIVYLVTEVAPYKANPAWIDVFGERMILQLPDDMTDPPPDPRDGYAYLIQFMDGNRIDLTLYPVDKLEKMERDSQSILLLDKDGIVEPFPPASDKDYLPKPPSAKQFDDCCNEFWWVSPYVAKGLWREEITYAKHMEFYAREQLMKMLDWYVGVKTNFQQSPGKMGKYLDQFLEPELWALLVNSYSSANYNQNWEALFALGELFRRVALPVAEHFGYAYPFGDDERVSAHLRHVRMLPKDAPAIY